MQAFFLLGEAVSSVSTGSSLSEGFAWLDGESSQARIDRIRSVPSEAVWGTLFFESVSDEPPMPDPRNAGQPLL